jgi:ABC-type nitrate/sulfonate/bicarbonate transport system permease component
MKQILVWITFFAGVILIWDGVIRFGLVSPAALARPLETFLTLPRLFLPSENLADISSTVTRSLIAFLISIPCGLIAGVACFYAGRAKAPGEFTIDFLRSIPATALVPMFLIIFGIGDSAKIAAATFSSSLVIALSVIIGLRGRNLTRLGVARIFGLTGLKRVLLLDLPEAAPQIFLGLRTGISLALILVVVAEMLIGSNHGVGKVILDMQYTDDKGRMYAAIIVAGGIGYLYNLVLGLIERSIHWRGYQ